MSNTEKSTGTMREPADVRHQAALWLIELSEDRANADLRRRWQHWHDAAPEHRAAWAKLEAFGAGLKQVPAALAHATLAPRKSRRLALKRLALLLAGGGATLLAVNHRELPILLAGVRTAPGQRRQITLHDGSRVDLNADSALDIHVDAFERRLILRRGEIHVTTAVDPAGRPFFVDTPQGRAQALGTRFTVRTLADGTRSHVAVYQGRVALRPRSANDDARVLATGQQADFSVHEVSTVSASQGTDLAWIHGMLVVEDMPLPAFVAEFARLTGQPLDCSPALAALKVSGSYPLGDPPAVLGMLVRTLPIRVETRQRWWGRPRHEILPT